MTQATALQYPRALPCSEAVSLQGKTQIVSPGCLGCCLKWELCANAMEGPCAARSHCHTQARSGLAHTDVRPSGFLQSFAVADLEGCCSVKAARKPRSPVAGARLVVGEEALQMLHAPLSWWRSQSHRGLSLEVNPPHLLLGIPRANEMLWALSAGYYNGKANEPEESPLPFVRQDIAEKLLAVALPEVLRSQVRNDEESAMQLHHLHALE